MGSGAFTAWIGVVLGSTGTALSIWNLVEKYLERRVRLSISPKLAFFQEDGSIYSVSDETFGIRPLEKATEANAFPAISITNFSLFPVMIEEVGFTDSAKMDDARAVLVKNDSIPAREYPYRVEPRENLFVSAPTCPFRNIPKAFGYMYVRTSCGHVALVRLLKLNALMGR